MVCQNVQLLLLLCLICVASSHRTGIARTRNGGQKMTPTSTTPTPRPLAAGTRPDQPHTFTVSVKGDFMIGVLFSLHHQPKQKRASNTISCGEIREMYGIQRTEATFFTLDRINSNSAILPNITLGVEIRDSCWYAPVALRQSIEFIRDAISLTGSKDKCAAEPNSQKTPLIGVIGPGSSSVALQVQNLLQLFQLPQIGYSTTSKDLSDKSRFGYFMRVVPSDYYQAQVIVDLVSAHNWTYVSAVNTDENYGQSGIQAFRELAERANVCIAKEDSVLSNAEDDAFERVLLNLERDPNARVVVCFCEGLTVRGLLGASQRLNLTGRFLFIGSDGWADRSDVVDGLEREAQGSISIRIHSPYVKEFDEYYFGLNPFNNQRNPWFKEFWETKFNCSLPGSATSKPGRANCTGAEQLRDRYKQEPKLSFVVKAIYTMAYGLHNMIQDVCGPRGFCKEIFPFNGSHFKSHLFNVTFPYGDGENEEIVGFDRKGDPPGRYNIMNYQKLPNGSYEYVHVGDWNNGTVTFQKELQFAENVPEGKVESVCSKPCAPGFYRSFTGGQEQKCCWACVQCDQNQILVDPLTCEACSLGYWPNPNKTVCVKIPIEFTKWSDSEAIVAIAFSALGFISTIFAGVVFVKFNNTPVVKSSTRELSYLILAGMGLSHATTFPILAQPTKLTCSLSRTLPGLSFAMIYASLLIKTNRIARILAGSKKRFPKKNLRFMSATAQVLITIGLIGLEVSVSTIMLFLEPAKPTLELPAVGRAVLVCNTTPLGVLGPLAFDFLLIGLCTLYALKTRNVPENFNEAKFIGFAMYTTCVIWIAFVPIYFGSNSKIITMCMCVTLSAMVTLVFLFFPKLYIILLQPERNNRALFTTAKSIRCHIGSRVASAINEKGVPYGREGLRMNQSLPLMDQNKPFWTNNQQYTHRHYVTVVRLKRVHTIFLIIMEIDYADEYMCSRRSVKSKDPDFVLREFTRITTAATDNAKKVISHEMDNRYGDGPRQMYDLYGTNLPPESGIFVFIHGGFWQALDKSTGASLAEPLYKNNLKLVAVGYDLSPQVKLNVIIDEIHEFGRHILEMAANLGSSGVWIAGHSAGAHLASCLLNPVFLKSVAPEKIKLLKGLVLISGIYELLPILKTSENEALQLTTADAVKASTDSFFDAKQPVEFLIAVASEESSEFHRQSKTIHEKAVSAGMVSELVIVPGNDHFTIIENLSNCDFQLTKKIVSFVKKQ